MRPLLRCLLTVFLFAELAGCGRSHGRPPDPPSGAGVVLHSAFGPLTFDQPVALLQSPSDDARWFVVEKGGTVWSLSETDPVTSASVFIDLSDRVESNSLEAGLLGMAFHPSFPTNGEVFLSYTHRGNGGPLVSRISIFTSPDGGGTLDPATEAILLSIDQPYPNHNGGNLAFGPDGYLYAGFGDGGAGGDPMGNGQDTGTLLGALLRIDIDQGTPYAVPPDNPFADGGGRPEIYAWGFRNPWRFSFDRGTGELWAGDVGQDSWEEIDKVHPGENYGWNVKEGTHCFSTDPCNLPGLTDPIAEYGRDDGGSVTGGFVYRGTLLPFLSGVYVFGDFISGKILGLSSVGNGAPEVRSLIDSGLSIASFGEGRDGELYVLDFTSGAVYRLDPAPPGA